MQLVVNKASCHTVFESHDDVVGGARSGALGVVRLYVYAIQRVLLQCVQLAAQPRLISIVISCSSCARRHGDVQVGRARVVALVADVVADQTPVVMQRRRTLQSS